MNERIKKLREQTLSIHPSISLERAKLITQFYKSGIAEQVSNSVARALSFKHILENKALCVNEGELIIGERGPAPHATPTYPEICTHTLNDFNILDARDKISFSVDKNTKADQLNDIIPYWSGRSLRDKIFKEMDEGWKDAYSAGIFTEFMEQRAPGHTVMDDKIYRKGFNDFIGDIDNSISKLDFYNDAEAFDKREELNAMRIAAKAIIDFAKRYGRYLDELAVSEKDVKRKIELETMAGICKRVPENKPKTFWEALQYYWFIHLGVITELNTWDSFNPGRLDQHLYCLRTGIWKVPF